MKRSIYIIALLFSLTNCGNKDGRTSVSEKQEARAADWNRRTFKNIAETIQNQNVCLWFDSGENPMDRFLSFSPDDYPGKLILGHVDFLLLFPFKNDATRITVYWDTVVKGSVDPNLMAAIKNTGKKYLNQPFMTLELASDTSLKASYLFPEFIDLLNRADSSSIFFSKEYSSGFIQM